MKYRFQNFELDSERRELLFNSHPIPISPKAFALLTYLIEHKDRMVSKRELLEAFWPTNVGDAALLKTVSLIRKTFSEVGTNESIIKTYHGLGYRLIAKIGEEIESAEKLETDGKVKEHNEKSVQFELSEQRLVSVICVRFTESESETDQEEHRSLELKNFLAKAQATVEKHQGQLLHMMFDSFTAAFGLTQLYEDVARRSVRCAAELLHCASLTDSDSGFPLTIGVDTGPVTFNKEENLNWTPPNGIERLAIDLSIKANKGQIQLSKKTREQLSDEAETEPTPHGYRLISPPSQRAGIPGRPHKRPSKFVGRNAEIAFLSAKLDTLPTGPGQALMLSGPAGIGKNPISLRVAGKTKLGQHTLCITPLLA